MKLQAERTAGSNVVSNLLPGEVAVNGVAFRHSLLLPWQGDVVAWGAAGFDALQAADFDLIAELQPELVIFGSGARIRFASPALLRTLLNRQIGVETMDTSAACRTYNVLVSEGRKVVAALLLGS